MINILGIGVIGKFGRGLNNLEAVLLNEKMIEPELVDVHGLASQIPIYSVKKEDLKDKALSRKMRRADRFSKMAVIAASDALKDSGLSINADNCDSTSVGIILSTGFGPHATTFNFLDGYIDFGEAAVSPTSFSHSVHNAAASYISNLLGVRGPTQTVTDFELPFQNAFLTAEAWLKEGRCESVLLGSVDELGEQMEYVFNRIYSHNIFKKNDVKNFTKTSIIPGEGAVFFLLSKSKMENSYCKISSVAHCFNKMQKSIDLQIIDSSLMIEKLGRDQKDNLAVNRNTFPIVDYRSYIGDMKINTAFNVAIGALMLKKQCCYSQQTEVNNIDSQQKPLKIISCSKFCNTNNAVLEIYLKNGNL